MKELICLRKNPWTIFFPTPTLQLEANSHLYFLNENILLYFLNENINWNDESRHDPHKSYPKRKTKNALCP